MKYILTFLIILILYTYTLFIYTLESLHESHLLEVKKRIWKNINNDNQQENGQMFFNQATVTLKDASKQKKSSKEFNYGISTTKPKPVLVTTLSVIVLSCNRPSVKRCLDKLVAYRPSKERFPIYVANDCFHINTMDVLMHYLGNVTLLFPPDETTKPLSKINVRNSGNYYVSRHYHWVLNKVFNELNFNAAIILDDDLEIAEDFFEYFSATYDLLLSDRSIWCVSAWNDNGRDELIDVSQPQLLYRTDSFPGTGWMLTKDIWQELSPKWPPAYWDDWIQQPEQRRGRSCIRPEISRVKSNAKFDASTRELNDKYLKNSLNFPFVKFTDYNLDYLIRKDFDNIFLTEVYEARVISLSDLKLHVNNETVQILYSNEFEMRKILLETGLMYDFRGKTARTSYCGIVPLYTLGKRVYISPQDPICERPDSDSDSNYK